MSMFSQILESSAPLHEKMNHYRNVMNSNPKASFIQEHEGNKYIPISYIEYMLDQCFDEYSIEITSSKLELNSYVASVRINYIHPITGKALFHDGIGAQPLQLNRGSKPMDVENIKKNAIQMAAPIAVSYAVKDAAERFGRVFGRDIGREFQKQAERIETPQLTEELKRPKVITSKSESDEAEN